MKNTFEVFKKWLKKPLTKNQVIMMYISWLLIGILYIIFK